MNEFMKAAIEEARGGIHRGEGGPFGCVIVRNGVIIGRGHNEVIKQKDPTCHGEIMAIRDACRAEGTHDLSGCELYTTASPCPMCLGALLWARIKKVYYGCTVHDMAGLGFSDEKFFTAPEYTAEEMDREDCLGLFSEYHELAGKAPY